MNLNKKFIRLWGTMVVVSFLLLPFSQLANALTSDPSPNAKLAVTPAGFDDMGAILDRLGFSHNEISLESLSDIKEIEKYDALYLNCSNDILTIAKDIAPVIKKYVEGGGMVYASDFADILIETAFPDKIDFEGDDKQMVGGYSLSHVGIAGEVTAEITDSGLASVLGKEETKINFDMPAWAVMNYVAPGVRLHMKGPMSYYDFSSISDLSNPEEASIPVSLDEAKNKEVPYVVSFSAGEGEVLYTSFHNEAQNTEDMEKILNWFAVKAKASKIIKSTRSLIEGGDIVLQEVIDFLSANETKEYSFDATGDSDFKIILNPDDSTLRLVVIDPNGKEIINKDISDITTEDIKAIKGEYTFKITGESVGSDNNPFVLLVAGVKEAAAGEILDLITFEETSDESLTPPSLTTETPKINQYIQYIIVILIVGGIATGIVIIKRRKTPGPPAPKN